MRILQKVEFIHIVKKLDESDSEKVNEASDIIESVFDSYGIHNVSSAVRNPNTLFISVGGDGTMLYAARLAAAVGGYVIGFNLGKLGFLTTDLLDASIEKTVKFLLTEEVEVEERIFLSLGGIIAMNEFLFQPNNKKGMPLHNFVVKHEDKIVSQYNASGLLVSTPSGSTAFSVSLNGAIMSPKLKAIQVIPLAAHSLMQGAHPIILPSSVNIQIELEDFNKIDIISDGQEVLDKPSLPLNIDASNSVKFLHLPNWNFFDVLTQKMGWK